MIIKITNLTTGPVSLPGVLPRLNGSDTKEVNISPEHFDHIKDKLQELIDRKTIDMRSIELAGSYGDNYTLDDDSGSILFKGATIAPTIITPHALTHIPGGTDALSTAAPPIGIGANNIEGSATSFARSDHNHKLRESGGPVDLTIGLINDGESLKRSGTSIVGYTATDADEHVKISATDTTAAYLDNKITVTGGIGKLITSPGGDEKLQLSAPALTSSTPADVTKAAAVVGAATTAAKADHKHDVSTAAPPTGIGGGNIEGSATSLARSDHDHKLHETGGPTDLTVGAVADGQALRRTGTVIVGYTPTGTDEYVKVSAADTTAAYLNNKITTSGGVSKSISSPGGDEKLDLSSPALASTTPADVTKSVAVVGVGTTSARSDHKHDVSTGTPGSTTLAAVAAEGSATSLARSDHTHGTGTPAAPVNVTKAAASAGTSSTPARDDHKHDITTAAPTVGIGASNAEGVATSLARSDHNHTLRETSGPTNLTVGSILAGQRLTRSGSSIVGQDKFVFIAATDYSANVGNFRVRAVAGSGSYRFTFHVPFDFNSIVSAGLVVIPAGDVVGGNIDLSTEYGAIGEVYNLNTETDTTSTYSFTTNQLGLLSITTVLTGVAAGDYVGLLVNHLAIGTTLNYLGLLLRYQ